MVQPASEVVRARLARLRRHRWSSYPAYVGRAKRPDWLTCEDLGAVVGNASAAAVGSAVRRMDRLRKTHAGIRKRLAAAEVHLTDNET